MDCSEFTRSCEDRRMQAGEAGDTACAITSAVPRPVSGNQPAMSSSSVLCREGKVGPFVCRSARSALSVCLYAERDVVPA